MVVRALQTGDPAPWFNLPSLENPRYEFSSAAGRYILLAFFEASGSTSAEHVERLLGCARPLFDDGKLSLFGVSTDAADASNGRLRTMLPGIRFLIDSESRVSRAFGVVDNEGRYRPTWYLLDPQLRVRALVPFEPAAAEIPRLVSMLEALPPADHACGVLAHAPVLCIPDVFEPELRLSLMSAYEAHGGEVSGFMQEVGGRTVGAYDNRHKSRRDHMLTDERLRQAVQDRIIRRVVPEIAKVHQFRVTRMERYLVGCYSADEGGHFGPHRDNTTNGTAHRRFAVSINLNDDFEGGEVGFPEYGARTYKMPAGGAVVFSCSLLHRVTPVRAGRRYAFLPFLYDEAAAQERERRRAAEAAIG